MPHRQVLSQHPQGLLLFCLLYLHWGQYQPSSAGGGCSMGQFKHVTWKPCEQAEHNIISGPPSAADCVAWQTTQAVSDASMMALVSASGS
jgi:hypothetical protein